MDIDIKLVSFTSVRLFDRTDVRVVAAYASLYDTTTNISKRGNNVVVRGGELVSNKTCHIFGKGTVMQGYEKK